MGSGKEADRRTPIGSRVSPRGLNETLLGLTRENFPSQLLAGVTLLAIAIPEQLATSQLAGVPAFTAMIAFIAASLAFFFVGSNPIMSVGADSTIAPLFAVVLVRLAPASSVVYLELVAAAAVVTGLIILAIGLFKLGWIADFLSLPIVAGFLGGIGVIIIVHQLPRALGVNSGGESVFGRLNSIVHHLNGVSAWSVGISIATLALMLVGERINPKLPWALGGVFAATLIAATMSLARHGVAELGTVSAGVPTWRLHWLGGHQWSVVITTSVTLVIVILSQTAATARTSADAIGVADNLSRDFVGVGLSNIAAGLVGAFPVDASPARTTVTRLAGGRTKLVGLVAALGAILLSPLAKYAHMIPLAALAGVLFFIAGRLVKLSQFRSIWQTSRIEFALSMVSGLGVVLLGVEEGIAIAVGLAILDQTWHSARPRMVEMGRRKDTTSWEPYDAHAVERVDHILAVLFDKNLLFANADGFRREIHELLVKYPHTKHLIVDAVAISEIDYTGLVRLGQVVEDLVKDHVSVSFARANEDLRRAIAHSNEKAIRHIGMFDSVDAAAVDALKRMKD
ncbi:MAG: SulP family inorganic anion transporter [Acidimicrobiaceae bacterium]|nr:SulP family inorganic anion transporter [Acidimicrobiaceae bacterium]